MGDRLAVLPQYLLPKQALTQLAGRIADAQAGGVTTGLIRWFVDKYGVNMAEAAEPDIAAYASFNDFFTRALKPGARPLASEAEADWLCPVDGAISQFGPLDGEHLVQAKGHNYTATALVGGDAALARRFNGGHFATLYLSPRDYHRIHMPAAGRLRRMIHVPGELFSVNPTTARGVPGLFARNERVVCVFDGVDDAPYGPAGRSPRGGAIRTGEPGSGSGSPGPFVLVLVGATIVGSMATVWQGVINPPRSGAPREWTYDDRDVTLARGAEMGRFLLGSTVVLLFPPGPLQFNPRWAPGGAIRMGEVMANGRAGAGTATG